MNHVIHNDSCCYLAFAMRLHSRVWQLPVRMLEDMYSGAIRSGNRRTYVRLELSDSSITSSFR